MKFSRAETVRLALIGAGMGAANVVPGVSGGTVALITGVFVRLVASLKSFNGTFARFVVRRQFRKAFMHIDGTFLLPLVAGAIVSILSLAKLATYLLAHHPVHTWAFFFGLIVVSIFKVGARINRWRAGTWSGLAIAAVATYAMVGMMPAETSESLIFIFGTGVLSISAMILPGISGSYVLIILGKYEYILEALLGLDIPVIVVFTAGCAIGLVGFAHALNWLLKRYADITMAVLTGLMAGSLRKVWPWKETLESIIGRNGKIIPIAETNVLPEPGMELALAVVFAGVGASIVLLLGARRRNRNASKNKKRRR